MCIGNKTVNRVTQCKRQLICCSFVGRIKPKQLASARAMVQNIHIQQGFGAIHTTGSVAETGRMGRINGMAVQVLSAAVDVDDQILIDRFKRETGIDGSIDRKTLSERKLALGSRSSGLDIHAAARFVQAFGSNKTSTRLAQSYLQGMLGKEAKPKREANPSELANHFVALQKLADALRGSDDDFVAKLTPLPEGVGKLSELAERLRESGDDDKAMHALLADVDGMPEEQEQLGGMMKTLRFQPEQLKRKLRDAQKLPDPDARTREELLEAVDDELQELLRQHGSHLRAIDHALRNAGDQATANLAESYAELVHDDRASFARTLEKLVTRHPPRELSQQVIPLMKKTLANELGLGADQRSIDKVKLEALLTELAHIHISATLLEKMGNLVTSMKRLFGVPA